MDFFYCTVQREDTKEPEILTEADLEKDVRNSSI